MKGFIKITPRSYNMADSFMSEKSEWTISAPEMININHIVKFGENYIFTSSNTAAYPILTVETQEEIKKLIIEAQ